MEILGTIFGAIGAAIGVLIAILGGAFGLIAGLGAILGVTGIICTMVFGLAGYILLALGLSTIAKREGLSYPWLAWIPFVNMYLVGELIGDKLFGIPYAKWILSVTPIVVAILDAFITNDTVDSILGIVSLVYYILTVCAYYNLFKIYKPNSAMLFAITGAIIPPLMSLYVFLIRKNQRIAASY